MKTLKYLLYIILGLIVLFFLIGLLKPTVEYGHSITVNKSAKESWAVAQDLSKYDQWLKGFQSIELIEGEQGTIGSKYKVVVKPNEESVFEMIETIIDFKEFEFMNLHFDSEMMDFEQVMSFKEENGKTTIKTDSKVKGKNLMMRSMFACMELFAGAFTAQETENIENLKKVIEANTKEYYQTLEVVPNSIDSIDTK